MQHAIAVLDVVSVLVILGIDVVEDRRLELVPRGGLHRKAHTERTVLEGTDNGTQFHVHAIAADVVFRSQGVVLDGFVEGALLSVFGESVIFHIVYTNSETQIIAVEHIGAEVDVEGLHRAGGVAGEAVLVGTHAVIESLLIVIINPGIIHGTVEGLVEGVFIIELVGQIRHHVGL